MLVIKRPFIGFIIGTLLASVWPNLALLLSPLCLLFSFYVGRTATYFLFFSLVGVVWVNAHWHYAQSSALPLQAGKSQQVVLGDIGFVSRQGHKLEFEFSPVNEPIKLKVSCYRCPYEVMVGERWRFDLRIKPIHSFQNPGGFDYRKWMLSKGYAAQAYVYAASSHNQLIQSSALEALNALDSVLSPKSFPILRALVLGDKNGLSGADKRLIFSSGISHLFVVSGLHVGIVAGLAGLLVYWLQRPLLLLGWRHGYFVASMSGLGFACLYGFVTGFQVPALRAVLMVAGAVLMLQQTRFTHVLHYYVFALLMVMLARPLAFMDMGSWLSFSIVLALNYGVCRYGSPFLVWWLVASPVVGVLHGWCGTAWFSSILSAVFVTDQFTFDPLVYDFCDASHLICCDRNSFWALGGLNLARVQSRKLDAPHASDGRGHDLVVAHIS